MMAHDCLMGEKIPSKIGKITKSNNTESCSQISTKNISEDQCQVCGIIV